MSKTIALMLRVLTRSLQNKRLYVERSGFPMSLMVSVAVSKVGKSSIFFVEPGAKVNGAY